MWMASCSLLGSHRRFRSFCEPRLFFRDALRVSTANLHGVREDCSVEFILNNGGPRFRWHKARPMPFETFLRASTRKATGGHNFRLDPASDGAGHLEIGDVWKLEICPALCILPKYLGQSFV